MTGRSLMESLLGAVVLLVAVMFVVFAWTTADVQQVKGYTLTARFLSAGGVSSGADVRVSGIKVGSVAGDHLDETTYEAVVTLSLRPDVKLPTDTVATVASSGLLGNPYIRLKPGSAETTLGDGEEITRTEAPKSLEDLVGEVIFSATGTGGAS